MEKSPRLKSVNYSEEGIPDGTPTYLFDQAETYNRDAHEAGLEWFLEAYLGLSVFYGLTSLTGQREDDCCAVGWNQEAHRQRLRDFKCPRFDAMEIVELAIAAGARYISMPARYRDGFALYNSACNAFNSVKSEACRDLVGEMASACECHGLGLHLVLSHGFNAMLVKPGENPDDAWRRHLEQVTEEIHELLIGYGPLAAISLEGIDIARAHHPSQSDCQSLYDYMHSLQPQLLVGYQQGLLGTEDFHSVEEKLPTRNDDVARQGYVLSHGEKPVEIRRSLTPARLSYDPYAAGTHLKTDAIWEALALSRRNNANLLVNTALMPDGSLDLEDINSLLAVGERMESGGLPR